MAGHFQRMWCPCFVLLRFRFPLLLLCLSSVSAGAAPLTLQQAEAQLLQSNHDVLSAKRALESASAGITIAGQAPNPTLSYSATDISKREGVGSGSLGQKRMDQTLLIQQQLERGDRRNLRKTGAEFLEKAADADYADVRRQQRLNLHEAWFDWLAAAERKRLLSETAGLYKRSREAANLRLKYGDLARVDASRLSVEASRADNDARTAEAELDKARTQLALLIGSDKPQELEPVVVWPKPELPGAIPDLEARPDVRAALARIDAASRNRELARSLTTRDITVGAQVERDPASHPGVTYGLQVSVPLFVRYGYEGERALAETQYSASLEDRERVLQSAANDARRARADLAAAVERLQRIETEALPQAREVAAASEFAFTKGALGLTDLLDARRTLRAVELEAVAARADHAKARAAWLAATEWEITQ
jgi:cobalt-zinc-cadmium efflux system outer membrane protein